MEFPDVGTHCSEKTCRRLDFLPFQCDACRQDFCKDHYAYAAHRCPSAVQKDVRVPVCPLCDQPVPVPRGVPADVVVGEHMDRDCRAQPGRTTKVFSYRCSREGCRKKEMLPLVCDQCRANFCLLHRHPLDHQCRLPPRPAIMARCPAAGASEPQPVGAVRSLPGSSLPRWLSRWKVKR